ncbi:MAG: hypothetical protein H7Y59_19625 [Anaerolineales bacterium]|nr:hypothetical protein [Anaerolineales bacterium]
MTDRTLPSWVKIVLVISGLMQIVFGLRLLIDPSALTSMWPWSMTPVTARLLGCSTLVSVPLALLSVWFNRYSAARLPMIMIIAYRVLQLAAGFIHFSNFDIASPTTWNYFGGGGILLIILFIAVIRGETLGEPVSTYHPFLRGDTKLNIDSIGNTAFRAVSILFILLGVIFFILGENADWLWFEAAGNLTSLTARLFASPMIGLGIASWIITISPYWRQVRIPAVGLCTFGIAGILTLILESASVQPPSPFGYIMVAAPIILFAMGIYLLLPARASK